MKNDGALILEYCNKGVSNSTGEVYIHEGTQGHCVYSGPYALPFYQIMKRFIEARHKGSGDWFERDTGRGKEWRERGKSGSVYAPIE